MAEEEDRSQRTEEPTQKRLDEARERGQLASSREVSTAALFGTAALLTGLVAPEGLPQLARAFQAFLEQAPRLSLGDMGPALSGLLAATAIPLALPALAFMLAPILAAVLQNAVVWTGEPLQPKFERVSPFAGAGRIFSPKALAEFGKGLIKMTVVGAAAVAVLWPERWRIMTALDLSTGAMTAYLGAATFRLLAAIAVATAVLALLDYAHARFAFRNQLRMTRQEVLEEHKQSEGDPITRQRIRQIRMERARRRMMADVPKATLVVTNPTHFAVALRYVAGETPAPKVMAKGTDAVALTIRTLAREHSIPVIESPPLARALHATAEVGDYIPTKYYQAVAEIIGYVMRLRNRVAKS
ncbi:MAG: flagellar biosynthesis protein FlhB [Geminicoccaceae bacterium]